MRILNSTFWMSPIGLITGLIVALGLLWEDYKTWKEGGNSLIDWEKWQPAIDKAKDAITWFRDKLLELKDSVGMAKIIGNPRYIHRGCLGIQGSGGFRENIWFAGTAMVKRLDGLCCVFVLRSRKYWCQYEVILGLHETKY